MLLPPRFVQLPVVVFGVVGNDDDAFARASAHVFELFEESPKALAIKDFVLAHSDELAVAQAHRAKVSDAFARGGMAHHWVALFRGDPHLAARAMLLEMNFIQRPQVHGGISGQREKFFYAPSGPADQHWPLPGAEAGSETPTG